MDLSEIARIGPPPIALPKRRLLRLAGGRGTRIEARQGELWLTRDGDRRDVVLRAGQEHVVDGDGALLVQALSPALLVVWPPAVALSA